MRENERLINKLAQGLMPIEDGIKLFANASELDKTEIMKALNLCVFQSHPTESDIEKGILLSGLKPTYSPCVIVTRKPFNEARAKAMGLKGIDRERAFLLFVSIFLVADQRRRETECKDGCSHEWHNLSNSYQQAATLKLD